MAKFQKRASILNILKVTTICLIALKTLLIVLTLSGGLHIFKFHSLQLKPFVSDGCSSFPDGTYEQKELWLACCTRHDYEYWKGGTVHQRLDSDRALRHCVAQQGEPEIAFIMLVGVRIGGSPWLPTPFRWGYGWEFPKLYGELTEIELEEVDRFSQTELVRRVLGPL